MVFIFRRNNELLISQSGKVKKGKWELVGHNTLLLDRPDGSYLFRHGFLDEKVLALKTDGKQEYALLVNEDKAQEALQSRDKVNGYLSNYEQGQELDQSSVTVRVKTSDIESNTKKSTKRVRSYAQKTNKEKRLEFKIMIGFLIALMAVVALFIS